MEARQQQKQHIADVWDRLGHARHLHKMQSQKKQAGAVDCDPRHPQPHSPTNRYGE